MVRIIAAEIAAIFPNLAELNLGYAMGGNDVPKPEELQLTLSQVIRLCNLLGWKDLSAQAARLLNHAKKGESGEKMEALSLDLRDAFEEKTNGLHAVLIEERDAGFFTDAVAEVCGSWLHADLAIPEDEFTLAGKALALGLSTASVFHSMRAVEASLHVVARVLGITGAVELQGWKALTDKIKSETDRCENKPRTPQKAVELKRLADLLVLADGFRLVT